MVFYITRISEQGDELVGYREVKSMKKLHGSRYTVQVYTRVDYEYRAGSPAVHTHIDTYMHKR